MARKRPAQDSLDLLLDTICNTFGGVLFVAILISLMIQDTKPEAKADEASELSPIEMNQLSSEADRLNLEWASILEAQKSQESIIAQLASDELVDLLEDRKRLQDSLNEKKEAVHRRVTDNALIAEEITSQQQQLDSAMDQEKKLNEKISSLKQSLKKLQQAKSNEDGAPEIKTDRYRQEVPIIMKYGRIYLWHDYGERGQRRGLNTKDFVVTQSRSSELSTTPLPSGGFSSSESSTMRESVKQMLTPFSPRTHYLAIVVRPDSFSSFKHFRNVIKQMGYDYRLLPSDGPAVDRGGVGGQVQ